MFRNFALPERSKRFDGISISEKRYAFFVNFIDEKPKNMRLKEYDFVPRRASRNLLSADFKAMLIIE